MFGYKKFIKMNKITIIVTFCVCKAVSDDWKDNADVAWFTGSETQYILSTPEELAGLAQLVNQGERILASDFLAQPRAA